MKTNIFMYCFILILLATLAVVWFLYRHELQQFEYFTSSPNDCVIYYTLNKKACDAGYYLMSDQEFNIKLKDSKLKRDFNLENVKKERDGTIGRVCKLKYNGWAIDPNIQPTDNSADNAVINARGNVNTWMMCRRNILPKPTVAGQLYSAEETQKEFEKYQNLFGSYQNVSIEKTPYTPTVTNVGKPLTQAAPEYIHMYFTNSIITDTNSVCANPTVDYKPNIISIAPQYGLELRIINQNSRYYINKINLIKILSQEDNSHFVYEDSWNTPNIDKIVELFYRPNTNTTTKTIFYTAQNIQMNIYKLLLDECNKLVNLSKNPAIITRVINSGTLFKLPRQDITTTYPFGIRLKYDVRDKTMYNLSYILNYNETNLQTLTERLEQYIQLLETDYTTRLNNVVGNINDFIKQYGYCYETYTVPPTLKNNVDNAAKTNSIFTDNIIKDNILENDSNKLVYSAIHDANGFIFNAKNNEFTIIKTHLIRPKNIVAGTYNFQLHIRGHDLKIKPANFYVEVLYNEAIVNNYYYCASIDSCKTEKNNLLEEYRTTLGTSSLQYINLKKSINANECYKTNCTIASLFKLEFPLTLNTDINSNRLEIRIYSNYPPRSTTILTGRLYYTINNKLNIYPKNSYCYNVEDYTPIYRTIFYDKQSYYYPAKKRIQDNNDIIIAVNNGLSAFKSQLRENISNISIDAFNLLNISRNNVNDFISRYLSGNERIYMFFTTPKTYTPIATDNRIAIEDFNKYLTTK
jgi:hypothetical protein